jgi:hypothetical protein
MREARRQKTMDQIDKLEKALRNIGFLGAEIKMTDGYTWSGNLAEAEEGEMYSIIIIVNEFLHALYHAIKRSGKEDKTDANSEECDMCGLTVSSSVVHNNVRVCENCVRARGLWYLIPDEDMREAGWIV